MDQRDDASRVSVDTLTDWHRIKATYTSAALAQLEARVASSCLTQERDALLLHLKKYIETTFSIAQPNLRVNGRNFEELGENEEAMEGFDEALDRAVWSLSDQRLKSDRDIAEKRRNKPRNIEALFRDHFREQEKVDTHHMVQLDEDVGIEDADMDSLSQHPELDVFQMTAAMVDGLLQSIPTQRERSERIRTVSTDVRALKT